MCREEDNVWIVKPWNLGRGLDIHITDNLVKIVRLSQASPKVSVCVCVCCNYNYMYDSKICSLNVVLLSPCVCVQVVCKYITDPVLFHREEIGWVKFDVRYVVLLVSANPLTLYAYNTFWLRFANK